MTNDWQKLYLESVKSRAALEREIDELRSQILKATSSMMGVGDGDGNLFVYGDYDSIKAVQAIVLERDALKAEIEKEKAKAHKAQEVADWHLSHRTFAESQLEAARKQEPVGEWKVFNPGRSGEFGRLISELKFEDGQKFYTSPVPAQQSEAPLTINELEFLQHVMCNPGCKLDYCSSHWEDDGSEHGRTISHWPRLEELGLIECVGSYKWVSKCPK